MAVSMVRRNAPEPGSTWVDLEFINLVREVIDLRSFSNLWYWIALAVLWSTLSHWVLGVPYDVVLRAARGNARAAEDVQILAQVNVRRILTLTDMAGALMIGLGCFVLTGLGVLGWAYGVEFAQAVFLLLLPSVLVGLLSVRTARKLHRSGFADLPQKLRLHRIAVQMLGVVFIFLTAFWGMWINVTGGFTSF